MGCQIAPTKPPPGPEAKALSPVNLESGLSEPSQRRRRHVLVAGLVVVGLALVISAYLLGSSGTEYPPRRAASTVKTDGNKAKSASAGGWKVTERLTLKPVGGETGKALAGISVKGAQTSLLIVGNGLDPSSTVGIWLVGGGKSGLVGFQNVNAKGQFSAVGPLPSNVESADTLVVTSETVQAGQAVPSSPGRVLLSSPFSN